MQFDTVVVKKCNKKAEEQSIFGWNVSCKMKVWYIHVAHEIHNRASLKISVRNLKWNISFHKLIATCNKNDHSICKKLKKCRIVRLEHDVSTFCKSCLQFDSFCNQFDSFYVRIDIIKICIFSEVAKCGQNWR